MSDTDTIDETAQQLVAPGTHLQLEVEHGEWKLRDDGRSVRGRIVPYREPSIVIERGERFREQFLPGCLTRMCQLVHKRGNAGWVSLNLDHDESFAARIGYASTIDDLPDGGWADFKLYRSPDLDKVRSMLEESHTGLSVMFDDIAPPRLLDGVRSRVQIAIAHVAATAFPVYRGAQIASVRDGGPSAGALTSDEIDERPALDEWRAYLDTLHA